jgi:hypothetical protein
VAGDGEGTAGIGLVGGGCEPICSTTTVQMVLYVLSNQIMMGLVRTAMQDASGQPSAGCSCSKVLLSSVASLLLQGHIRNF